MCSNKKLNVVFFGTPKFAALVLQYLIDHGINIVAVVTKPDRPQGRSLMCPPTAVKSVALSQPIPLPLFQPDIISSNEWIATLNQFKPDLFVVVAYGEILKQHLLDVPSKACINLHASLLPKYRGAAPIQRSIINGETESGVTIIHMAKKMDAGDVLRIEMVPIPDHMTYGELEDSLCQLGSRLLFETIQSFNHTSPTRTPQNYENVTFAPKITTEECLINWKLHAKSIHNLVRGVNPSPGAFCLVNIRGKIKRLRIIETVFVNATTELTEGTLISDFKNELVVACGNGSIIKILKLQPESKKIMSAEEFIRGIPTDVLSFKV